jgi:hypothetical protein
MAGPGSKPELIASLQPGERVYRWWDDGWHGSVQPLTVIRVNRMTVTVRTDEGSSFRLPHADVEGRVDWPEDD